MRRRVIIAPILLLAAVLLARRRLRARPAARPLATPSQDEPIALLEPGERFVSVPWTIVEADPADPRVRIRCCGDEHMELDRVDAQETPTQVFVTVLMRWTPPPGGRGAESRPQEAVVSLSQPLGTRELVHTPVDVETASRPGGDGPSASSLYP